MEIKNVIFDFGGVLLDWNPRYLYNDVFNDKEKMEYFLEHICSGTWNAQMDKGVPFKDAVARLQEQYPEYKEEIALYETGWPKMLKGEIADGIDIFNKVKESGRFKIYGLTNWSAETFPVAFSRYRFLDDFEGIVVSGEEEMIKPEKGIYHTLLERYHLKPQECVFIDDSLANVNMANSLGIHAVHCVDFKLVRAQLSNLLKLDL